MTTWKSYAYKFDVTWARDQETAGERIASAMSGRPHLTYLNFTSGAIEGYIFQEGKGARLDFQSDLEETAAMVAAREAVEAAQINTGSWSRMLDAFNDEVVTPSVEDVAKTGGKLGAFTLGGMGLAAIVGVGLAIFFAVRA